MAEIRFQVRDLVDTNEHPGFMGFRESYLVEMCRIRGFKDVEVSVAILGCNSSRFIESYRYFAEIYWLHLLGVTTEKKNIDENYCR
jgi:hypothetical protein